MDIRPNINIACAAKRFTHIAITRQGQILRVLLAVLKVIEINSPSMMWTEVDSGVFCIGAGAGTIIGLAWAILMNTEYSKAMQFIQTISRHQQPLLVIK